MLVKDFVDLLQVPNWCLSEQALRLKLAALTLELGEWSNCQMINAIANMEYDNRRGKTWLKNQIEEKANKLIEKRELEKGITATQLEFNLEGVVNV